jgi:predicted RNase H-like HicB family nuclease
MLQAQRAGGFVQCRLPPFVGRTLVVEIVAQGGLAASVDEIEVLRSLPGARMRDEGMLKIEIEREQDGRWIGEVPELPGVLAYGATEAEVRVKTAALALRVIADRIEHGEPVPFDPSDLFVAA